MSGTSAPASEPVPECPKCDQPMVLRTARKGANAGNQFWGCSKYPRCRGVVPYEPTGQAPARGDVSADAAVEETQHEVGGTTGSDTTGESEGFLSKVARTVDKGWRWYLESDEPDATGRWDDAHRRRMLTYIHNRDGGRCGLCAGEMKLKGAQIEHVVPKVFAVFDVRKGGKAEPGTRYKSRLHKIDNLQAAHTYCNKREGNTPEITKWRHPAMPPLTVADTDDGRSLVVPQKPLAGSAW